LPHAVGCLLGCDVPAADSAPNRHPLHSAKMVQFQEIQVNVVSSEADKVGLDTMLSLRGREDEALPSDAHGLAASLDRLYQMLDSTKQYVDDVLVRGTHSQPLCAWKREGHPPVVLWTRQHL
jgi:hypothetical protein